MKRSLKKIADAGAKARGSQRQLRRAFEAAAKKETKNGRI